MRIIIITQNEPFYLRSSLNYLIKLLPKNHKIVGCIVGDVSPFGKKESFLEKALKTFRIFGIFFFIHYTLKFLKHKLFEQSLNSFLISRYIIPRLSSASGFCFLIFNAVKNSISALE